MMLKILGKTELMAEERHEWRDSGSRRSLGGITSVSGSRNSIVTSLPDICSACRTRLLSLEPAPEAVGVEDVRARKTLRR